MLTGRHKCEVIVQPNAMWINEFYIVYFLWQINLIWFDKNSLTFARYCTVIIIQAVTWHAMTASMAEWGMYSPDLLVSVSVSVCQPYSSDWLHFRLDLLTTNPWDFYSSFSQTGCPTSRPPSSADAINDDLCS